MARWALIHFYILFTFIGQVRCKDLKAKNLCFSIEEKVSLSQPDHIHRILAPTFKQCADACVNYPRSTCTFVVYQRVSGSCRLYDADPREAKRRLRPSDKHVFGAITDCVDTTGIEINKTGQESKGRTLNTPQRVQEKWGEWTDWTPCSATCGNDGEQSRYRRCLSYSCSGSSEQKQRCQARIPCAQWSAWTSWSSCSVTCEQGIKTRNRFCPNYFGCEGARQEQEPCTMPPCIQWSDWSGWSACSQLCGGGSKARNRKCNGYGCPGQAAESEACNVQSCCANWSSWSTCSVTCGLPTDGKEARTRRCIVDAPGTPYGGYASKTEEATRPCSTYALRPCAQWTNWGDWLPCSKSCGGGEKIRRRSCSVDDLCQGRSEEAQTCNAEPCPEWSNWGTWSQCGVTCGGGITRRMRVCTMGTTCPGDAVEEAECNRYQCPRWSDWGPWDHCSDSCGGGWHKRSRVCDQYGLCLGDSKEKRICNDHQCPVAEEWSQFSKCDKPCGGGVKTRQRSCAIDTDFCKGEALSRSTSCRCGDSLMKDVSVCNSHECAVWHPWQEWAACTATCGGGQTTRFRKCFSDATFCLGANKNHPSCQCPDDPPQERKRCNQHACPSWSDWEGWGPCSVSCGGGTQPRERECLIDNNYCALEDSDPANCECLGLDHSDRQCNAFLCPEYSPWEYWGECSHSCGGGTRTRGRTCLSDAMRCNSDAAVDDPTCVCNGTPAQKEPCNQHFCAYYDNWSEWSPCSASCAGGETYRTRGCIIDTDYCVGEIALTDPTCSCPIDEQKTEVDQCNTQTCAEWTSWTPWSRCTNDCDGGSRGRTRSCNRDEYYCRDYAGASCQCIGLGEDSEECNTHSCARWFSWEDWQPCSVSCGGGQRIRERPCNKDSSFCRDNPEDISCKCSGSGSEVGACNTFKCPHWAEWAPWGSCSVTCSAGRQSRRRPCNVDSDYCTQDLLSYDTCQCLGIGSDVDTKSCDRGVCFQWSNWAPWSDCNVVCGGGSRTRGRSCAQEGGCPGSPLETGVCSNVPCPDWGSWSAWSDCSVSCNGGQRARTRSCPIRDGCSPGDPYESDICGTDECPIWATWTGWSTCSEECGHGERKRVRDCSPIPDGCLGRHQDIEACFDKPCQLNTHWSEWSPCTLTCGGGIQTRSRASCPNPGCAIEEDTGACQEQACPQWTTWDSWSQCTKTCGAGQRRRSRVCQDNGMDILNGCIGQPLQYDPVPCNDFACVIFKSKK